MMKQMKRVIILPPYQNKYSQEKHLNCTGIKTERNNTGYQKDGERTFFKSLRDTWRGIIYE